MSHCEELPWHVRDCTRGRESVSLMVTPLGGAAAPHARLASPLFSRESVYTSCCTDTTTTTSAGLWLSPRPSAAASAQDQATLPAPTGPAAQLRLGPLAMAAPAVLGRPSRHWRGRAEARLCQHKTVVLLKTKLQTKQKWKSSKRNS